MSLSQNEPGRRHPAQHVSTNKNNGYTLVFLTICVKGRRPLLANPESHRLLVEWWQKADRWLVGRYVIMPDHVHLFCSPGCFPEESLRRWVAYWKNGIARNWIGEKGASLWQRDFWDTQLRLGESYESKWEYVRHNPVRLGLSQSVNAWPYQGEVHQLEWHDG